MKLPDGWKYIKLSDIGNISKGSGIKREDSNSGTIPAVRYGELYTSHNDYIKEFYSFISEKVAEESVLLKKGDLLFTCSGETKEDIGKCAAFVSDCKAYAGGDLIIFSPKVPCDSKFLGFLCNSYSINKQRYRYAQGDSVVHISTESIANLKITFPPLAEQQKITEILCKQDKIIFLKQKLLEQKLQQKKWLMQKLLEVPHSNANCEEKVSLCGVVINKSKWKRDSLGNLGDFSKGSGIKREEANSGKIPAIRYGEIYTVHNEYIKIFYSFISNDVAKQSKLLKNGDLLFSCSGETKEDIGKCVAFVFNCEAYAGGDVIILSPKVAIDSMFFGFFLNSAFVNKQRFEFAQGDSIVHISSESLSKIKIYLPSLPEQKIIAQVLSTADKEIALLKSSIEQEKQKKKSLAQLLLTGTVRVKI